MSGFPSPISTAQAGRRSHFYAQTVAERLGQARDGLVRLGCACYTSEDEVDRVVESLRAIARSHD